MHNITEQIECDRMGGTAITGVSHICDVITEVGSDTTGLWRWSWLTLSGGTTTTHIISAYLPRKPNQHSRGRTVWEQHSQHFGTKCIMRSLSAIFITDLLSMISQWTLSGDHIILAMDANQDIYSGQLAQELHQDPYNMTCPLHQARGKQYQTHISVIEEKILQSLLPRDTGG